MPTGASDPGSYDCVGVFNVKLFWGGSNPAIQRLINTKETTGNLRVSRGNAKFRVGNIELASGNTVLRSGNPNAYWQY